MIFSLISLFPIIENYIPEYLLRMRTSRQTTSSPKMKLMMCNSPMEKDL